MRKAVFICLLLVAFAAFIKADGDDRICCHADPTGGDDDDDGDQQERQAWFLYIPSNVDIECHQEIMTQFENSTPDLTGYAFEANGCFTNVGTCASVSGNLGANPWCFDNGNDDDFSFGANDFQTTFSDTITPGCGNSFTVTRAWGSLSSCFGVGQIGSTQTIRVVDTTAPELNVPDDMTVECEPQVNTVFQSNDERFGIATVTDLCNQPTTITESSVVSGGPCTQVITRTFQASDGCDTSTGTQIVTIVDTTPPVIEHPPTFVMDCADLPIPTQTITAHDGCQGDIITAVLDSETTYPGACTGDFTVERVFTATDACGNVAAHTQVVIVEDNTPPVPATEDVVEIDFCSDTYSFPADPVAVDACSATVYVDSSDLVTIGGEKETGISSVVRTYTAADDCGNSVSWEQLFVFQDFTALAFDAQAEVFTSPYTLFNVFYTFGGFGCIPDGELVISFSPLEMDFTAGAGTTCTAAGEGSAVCPLSTLPFASSFRFTLNEYLPDYMDTIAITYQLQVNVGSFTGIGGGIQQTLVHF